MHPPQRYDLQPEEKAVLALLIKTPPLSYRELVLNTKYSYKKIKAIIYNLQEKGIMRFSIDPDYTKLGLEFHNLLIKINLAKHQEFEQNILKNQRVHWIKRGSGRWDYILSICSKDISEFIDITREIKTQNRELMFDSCALVSKINIMRKY